MTTIWVHGRVWTSDTGGTVDSSVLEKGMPLWNNVFVTKTAVRCTDLQRIQGLKMHSGAMSLSALAGSAHNAFGIRVIRICRADLVSPISR